MKQFSKDLGNVSLAPKGRWSKEQEYERLNLVYNACDNLSYVAKIDVPIGVEIDNREYWQPMNATGYADNNFINLTTESENGTVTAYESLEEAVATILPINRRPGATLSFFNLNADRLDRQAEFELWQFNSTDLANWEIRDYWNNIYYNWNVFAGWYVGADGLKNHVKIPNVGQYAYVGTNLNDALLYQCRTNGTWTNTGIKVRNYISVVVGGNITIGENGNWFSDGKDTGIPATPAVDEQLDNIIMRLQQHDAEISNLKKSDANLQDQITSNDSDITSLTAKHESLSRTVQGIAATGGASTANNVTYNNGASRLNAENVQDAIDELQASKINKTSILQESGDAEDKVMSQKVVSDKLNDLSLSVNDIKIGHDIITPFSVLDFAINDNTTWNKGGGYAKSIAIPIESSSKITITANDVIQSIYSITKNLDDISNLAKVNLAEGMKPRNYIDKGTSKDITVPSDGKYLVVTFVIAKEYSEYKPKEIIVDGFDILSSTKDIYDKHVAELAANKQELDIQKYGNIKSIIDSVGIFCNTNYVPYFFNGTSIVKSGDTQYKGFVFPIEYNSTYMFEGNTASGLLLENLDFSKFLEQTTLNNYVLNKTQIIKNSSAKFIFVTSSDSSVSIKKIENTHNNQIKDLSFFMKEFFGSCIYDNISNFYYNGSTIVETEDSVYRAIVIPVEANKTYYTYKSKYVNCLLCKAEPKVNSVNIEKTYPYTENIEIRTSDESKYLLFTIDYTKYKYVYLGTKKMLNVVCAGDSITEFSNGFDKQKTYPEYIEDFYGFNVVNIGIGGTRFCSRVRNVTSPIQNSDNAYAMLDFQNLSDAIVSRDFTLVDEATAYVKEHNKDDNTEIINRLKAIDWRTVDVLTLAFGTNDVLDTMGNYSDMDNNTMCGGINYIIKNILTKYPKISIMLIAPSHHAHNVTIPNNYNANKDHIIYDEDYVSEGGHTSKERGELIEKVAEFNHIPCLNLYKNGGFNRYNHKQYYCGNSGYLYDGVHPWTGFEYLGRKIGAFIKAQL